MINNSNLVALETLDKAVLIQMIQRYRQKEELQKQKLYGLSSVSTVGGVTSPHPTPAPVPASSPSSIVTAAESTEKPDKSERLKRSKSTSGMNYDSVTSSGGRARKGSTTPERKQSVNPVPTTLPIKEKSHKRSQFRGKLTLPGKKAAQADKDKTSSSEKHLDSERDKVAPSPRKELTGRSMTADRDKSPYLSEQSSLSKMPSEYDFNITTESVTSMASLTSSKLITVKELQEDSPVVRKKSASSFLENISMLAETGDEACELGMEYVQKMHNFACLLGGMKDQYPGSLENLLAKISDTLCDFQSFHLEFLKTLREEFVVPIRDYHSAESKQVEGLSVEYHNALAAYESTKQKVAKKINTKNRTQCEEEIEPHLEALRHTSLTFANKLNEIEMYGKPHLLSYVISVAEENFDYVESCASASRKYHRALPAASDTLTSALTRISGTVQELPVSLPKTVEEWDPKSTTIHGYMFYTTEKKGKWESAYFSIDYGYFIQMTFHNNKINKKRWNLLMSSVKPQNDTSRSFVLEVTVMSAKAGSPPQTILLQTESEEMRTRWITVITNAVMELLSRSKNTGSETSKQKTRIKMPMRVQKKLQNHNKRCVDCGEEDPDWASINLGILFCRNCSGPHRAMGTSISKVRSISIDNWDIQSYKLIEAIGNNVVNKILLHKYTGHTPSFTEQSEREKFIRRKYEAKEWMRHTKKSPAELTEQLLISVQSEDLAGSLSLILGGANVNGTDLEGYTPLHLAIKKGQYLQAQLCITNGASVNIKAGADKATPLHLAADNLDSVAVSQLISSGGADPEEKNADGKTAQQIATEKVKGGVLDNNLKLAFEGFDPSAFGDHNEAYSSADLTTETNSESDISDSLVRFPSGRSSKSSTHEQQATKPGDKILSMFETLQEEAS